MSTIQHIAKFLVALPGALVILWNVWRPDAPIDPEAVDELTRQASDWVVTAAAVLTPVLVYLVPNKN